MSTLVLHRSRLLLGLFGGLGLLVLLALSPLGGLADDLLGIFRVKRFAAVTVIPAQIPPVPADLSSLGSYTQPQRSKPKEVGDLEEASRLAGFAVRAPRWLPSNLPSPKISVMEGSVASYTFDLEKIRRYLASIGVKDPQLSPTLDGATIKATIAPIVTLTYGTEPLLLFGQTPSPSLAASTGLKVEEVRQELLTILAFFAPETALQLRSIVDWQSTLVIPVPQGSATSTEVEVQGSQGLLLKSTDPKQPALALIWQREGIVYGLSGNLKEEDLLRVARSVR